MNTSRTTYRDGWQPRPVASVMPECGEAAAFGTRRAGQVDPTPNSEDNARLTREHLGRAFESGYSLTVSALLGCGLYSDDAEEIAQQAWVKAYMHSVQLRDLRHIMRYVQAIAMNLLRDEKRRQARLSPLDADYPAPSRQTLRFLDLQRVIALSSPGQRKILQGLTQGYSTAEMGELLGISRGAVLARISRAIKAARTLAQCERSL